MHPLGTYLELRGKCPSMDPEIILRNALKEVIDMLEP